MRLATLIVKLKITDLTQEDRSAIGELIYKKAAQNNVKSKMTAKGKRGYHPSFVPVMEKIIKQYLWVKKKKSEVDSS